MSRRGKAGAARVAGARKRGGWHLVALLAAAAVALAVKTRADFREPPASLRRLLTPVSAPQFLARDGSPLNVTFRNAWNVHDVVALHEVPPFLRAAFIHAEDRRFYAHGGPDWLARTAALATNLCSGRPVRGASTITEQVVRMLHPRPRTVWSRWLEGFEAAALEHRVTKDEILEFYLNQVPYAANRRGVSQAASYYFARDLETLSRKEMLALAVLVRSPSRLDLRSSAASEPAIERLADLLVARGVIDARQRADIVAEELALERASLSVTAPHFVRYLQSRHAASGDPRTKVVTTLDAALQRTVQGLLDARLEQLVALHVSDGAVLVVDNSTRDVLAWVVAGGGEPDGPRTFYDAVTTPRQPGSTLKPFLYALALDSGWSAAHAIEDAPLAAEIGNGLHRYRNYSGRFYGPVSLREALGNSLNIPAVKTLRFVGADRYLTVLHALGFTGLDAPPEHYGDGIALGNAEVTLHDLVQGYVALANGGTYAPLRVELDARAPGAAPERVVSTAAASVIGDILADPEARALEFGRHSVLRMPTQTAVKTGTSSDFRDAWVVGFNAHVTVGVWLGNLDRAPTLGLTGSTGPALLLRSVLAELMRDTAPAPLAMTRTLRRTAVCVPDPTRPRGPCLRRDEWLLPGAVDASPAESARVTSIRVRQPIDGLRIAIDPRLPADAQALELRVDGLTANDVVRWSVDERPVEPTGEHYLWPLARGVHQVAVEVWRATQLVEAKTMAVIVK